jgi:methyl-accepting chemotaxis protein
MTTTTAVPNFEKRRAFYEIDERGMALLAETWPVIEPVVSDAINKVVDKILALPYAQQTANQHRDFIKDLEIGHYRILLGGNLDLRCAESCRYTVEQEAARGVDARIRTSAGHFVLKAALPALARKCRFSPAGLAERATVLSQVISFDVANAMTLHQEAAERAAEVRRSAIDAAIADFDGAIGAVIEAIKEASASLTMTGATTKQVADDTLSRMASASSASSETAQRMEATVTATEELSGSIQKIGQQATSGLSMARSAVADAERTQNVIGSLNDAADRIGSVIGTISAIAGQTNLLALNATIEAAAVEQQNITTRGIAESIHIAAGHTARASVAINSVDEAITRGVAAVSQITTWTARLSARASDLENQVATFFTRVRAA